MSENSKIEWCDHTFNPWVGCVKISLACDHCYAEGWAKRSGQVVWGGERKRTSIANWRLPVKWNKQAELMQSGWAHGVELHGGDESACIAAGFIKPIRPKVFCASLADVFDNEVPASWRSDLFQLIAETPNLDWLLLTKRVGNVRSMVPLEWLATSLRGPTGAVVHQYGWPENVWLGATICNQAEADRDIPKLLAVPAAKRFLSIEPLLGPVDLGFRIVNTNPPAGIESMTPAQVSEHAMIIARAIYHSWCDMVDWVVVGGESGPNARPMHPDWARSLRDQCQSAGVPFFFKQWGKWAPDWESAETCCNCGNTKFDTAGRVIDGKTECGNCGGVDWNASDKPHETLAKVGKKAAGRLLDGREWNGLPA